MSPTLLPAVVYVLCMVTSAACTLLLARAYVASRSRLLLWTSVSFGLLALNNLFLVLDMLVFRSIDLWPLRAVSFQAALVILLFGFIWEADR